MSSQQVDPVKGFNDNQFEENFENKPVDESSHKLSKRDYALMATYAYINIITGTVYSCLAPFFPKEAELKGLSPAVYGFLFSVQEIIAFILCPVIGVFLPKLGLRLTLLSGSIISSIGVIVFGALAWAPAGKPFAISCGIVRAFGSVGMAGLIAGMYATIPIFFPNHITQVFGLLEMSYGIGMIVGPLLGGVLYEFGGFGLPFYVCGGLMCISFPLIFMLCPESKENLNKENEKVGIIDILSNFRIFIAIFVTLVTCTAIGFLDVGLEPHLREFAQLRSSTVGVIFLVAGLFYGLSTWLVGLLLPKIKDITFLSIFGLILCGLAFVFVGPSYPVPIKPSIPLVIVCQILFGIGSSISLVSNFSQSMREKDLSDMKDDSGAASIISSLFVSIFSLGSAIGPIVGGQLIARYEFGEACTFVVGLLTATLLLVILTISFHKRPYTISESTLPRVVVQRLASTQHRNISKIKDVEVTKTVMRPS